MVSTNMPKIATFDFSMFSSDNDEQALLTHKYHVCSHLLLPKLYVLIPCRVFMGLIMQPPLESVTKKFLLTCHLAN